MKGTAFSAIYDCFLEKITDDLYVELTPEDTLRDIQTLLLHSLPEFEFPRCNLFDYTIDVQKKNVDEIEDGDFVLGLIWHELDENATLDDILDFNEEEEEEKQVLVECSYFHTELTEEEINILAVIMLIHWTQRQVTSIENTRMKYSGSDFKMTSQANHLQKLISLLEQTMKQSHHLQRLYKRRRHYSKTNKQYISNWDVFGHGVYYDRTDK